MEELNNQVEVLEVEGGRIIFEENVENEDEVIEEAESGMGKVIAVGTTLGLAVVTGGVFLAKKLKAKKRAKIEEEARQQIIETLRKAGKTDEEIEDYFRVSEELREENSKEKED